MMGGGRCTTTATTTTTITVTAAAAAATAAAAAAARMMTRTATTTTTTTTTTTATTTATATTTTMPATIVAMTTATTTTWQLPLWTRRGAARDRRLVLLGTHVHQHHLLLRDLAVLDVDRLRGIVQARRLENDQHRAEHAGHREYPQEDPVEHHRHVFPVLLHLETEFISGSIRR